MEKKQVMYRCAYCPQETETCVKMDYDSHQECVEPKNN